MTPAGVRTDYRDIGLFLWLIPCINVINYYLTYTHFGPSWRLIATFLIDTAQGYVAWWLVRSIIIWLDKVIPFMNRPARRIIVQLSLTLLAGSGSIIILTEFVNLLASPVPVPLSFYTKDIFIISIWFFVVNGIYIGLFFYRQWQGSEQTRKTEAEKAMSGFKVTSAKKDMLLAFEEIAGFYIDGDYCIVVTTAKQKFFVDSSLDKVEKTIPQASFFRLNRQYIAHRQLVAGFEKAKNGKINVLLREAAHLPETVPVSRTRAPAFKSWFLPS